MENFKGWSKKVLLFFLVPQIFPNTLNFWDYSTSAQPTGHEYSVWGAS